MSQFGFFSVSFHQDLVSFGLKIHDRLKFNNKITPYPFNLLSHIASLPNNYYSRVTHMLITFKLTCCMSFDYVNVMWRLT